MPGYDGAKGLMEFDTAFFLCGFAFVLEPTLITITYFVKGSLKIRN